MDLLFVCLGNICRSPAAEGVARAWVAEHKLDWHLDSAGTGNWHVGDAPHATMRKVAREAGTPIDDLKARQVSRDDFRTFDYIVAMDSQNRRDLEALQSRYGGEAKILLLLEGQGLGTEDVPDPYSGGLGDFQESYGLIRQGVESLLLRLQNHRYI